MRRFGDGQRDTGIEEIANLQRRAVAEIGLVVKLRAGIDIDDHGGAALNHGDFGAMGLQLLTDVMRAGAGAEYHHGPAGKVLAACELA